MASGLPGWAGHSPRRGPVETGQMLLSRGSWGLYLPSNLENSVLRSPRMVLAPLYVSLIKPSNPHAV